MMSSRCSREVSKLSDTRAAGRRQPFWATAAVVASVSVLLASCAPPGTEGEAAHPDSELDLAVQHDETPDGFDIDALIAAAQQESPITIYDETGKVVQIAEAFTEKYGVEATGVKMETGAIQRVKAEYSSGNIIGDVLAFQDAPTIYSELIRDEIITNWVPGDMREDIPEHARLPYLSTEGLMLWTYNPEVYGDTCPVDNIWQLTEPEWRGRVALPDPEARAVYTTFWNQAARNQSDKYEEAYERYFDEPLQTDEESSVHEWVARLAGNSPSVAQNEENVSEAVGASGQQNPPIGLMTASKYRNIKDKGFHLAACQGLDPYMALPMPQAIGYASKSKSPNAAKLYIHFATSQEGLDFVMTDGKVPYNSGVEIREDPYDVMYRSDEVQPYDTEYLDNDYRSTVIWQDFWRSRR